MVKTAIENGQNLVVEGCYIPFDWRQGFGEDYLREIRYRCLIMTPDYIRNHFADIRRYACVIEQRLDDSWYDADTFLEENARNLEMCRKYGNDYILIDDGYRVDIDLYI